MLNVGEYKSEISGFNKARAALYLVSACILVVIALEYSGKISAQTPGSTRVSLFYLDTKEFKLVAEERNINQVTSIVEQVKLTMTELIKGPASTLVHTIPRETEIREVFLDESGCAYINFTRDISQKHPGGTTGELVTIASIVKTLTTNFPEEIRGVQILIDGEEAKTIAGHIDISKPIFPFELK